MKNLKITIIAALSKDNGLGKDNQLLFKIKEDLIRFKTITSGHPIIMGRKTFETIGRPLPNRTNIIVTRQSDFIAKDCLVTHSLDEALTEAKKIDDQIFIIGGGEIYREALPKTSHLYLTVIDRKVPADTFFPDYKEFITIISRESHVTEDGIPYTFLELTR